jgi:YVTN family beta-propeller protein
MAAGARRALERATERPDEFIAGAVLCNGMDWRCALAIALVLPTVSQVSDIQFSALPADITIPVELERGTIVSADALWIPQRSRRTVVRVHASNNSPDTPIALPGAPCASLAESGRLWAAQCETGRLVRIDLAARNVSASMPIQIPEPEGSIAAAAHSVWVVSDANGVITRIDDDATVPVAEVYVPKRPFAVAAGGDSVWVTSEQDNMLTRIDAQTNVVVETIKVGPRPGLVVIGEGGVWTLNRGDGSVSRVDPATNKVVNTIPVSADIANGWLAAGEGAVWISAPGVPLVRIDPRTNRVTHRFVGDAGGMVVVGHGSVWVNGGASTTRRLDPKLVAAMRP